MMPSNIIYNIIKASRLPMKLNPIFFMKTFPKNYCLLIIPFPKLLQNISVLHIWNLNIFLHIYAHIVSVAVRNKHSSPRPHLLSWNGDGMGGSSLIQSLESWGPGISSRLGPQNWAFSWGTDLHQVHLLYTLTHKNKIVIINKPES